MLKLECIATKEVVSFRALLAAQSSLEELDLQLASLDMLNAVAENGAGLKRLAISGVDVCVPEPFYHMLKVTGETLLSLKVDRFENFHSYSEESGTSEDIEDHNGTIPFFDIKAIFRFCPHVEELRVYSELGPDCDQLEAVVDLYCSYGKGLKKLDSFVNEGVAERLMLKIAEHCPNALVRGAHFHQSDPTNLLGILGTRIPWLTIAAGFAHTAPDFPIYLSTRCCNVEHLNIELEYVEAFFLKPKPKLRSLALVLDGPIKVCEANISRVASSTGGLRKLQLHCPPFHRRFWEQIAWRNKDLDTIVVSLAHSYSVNIEAFYIAFMIDIVESLAPCTCLKQITVYTEDYISWKISAVADKCVIFRHRDVGVSLNGVDYLL